MNENRASVHWEAKYSFAQTKRKVHNKINAQFEFRDDKIIQHTDTFNFWKWSFQALGVPGFLFGWLPFLRKKVSQNASKALNKFIKDYSEYH